MTDKSKKDQMMQVIGENIRSYRVKKWRATIEELAEYADMNDKHLSAIERGEKEAGSYIIGQIAKALGVSTADLYQGTEDFYTSRLMEVQKRTPNKRPSTKKRNT